MNKRAGGIRVVHPTGNANVRQVLQALNEAELLDRFCTTLADRSGSRWLARRRYPVPGPRIETRPLREVARLAAARLGLDRLTRPTGPLSVDAIYRDLDRSVARGLGQLPRPQALYGYEDGAEASFRVAGDLGIRRIYELPIAYGPYARRITEAAAERRPAWAMTLSGLQDPPEKMERKQQELVLADAVVVPSRFVRDSIPEELLAGKACLTNPYACDLPETDRPTVPSTQGPLKVLFVGSMSQRKGLADLLDGCRDLARQGGIELHLMGTRLASEAFYRSAGTPFTYHPPADRATVLQTMRSCHVLALPSLIEGRALVQLEALACGMALLITPNTGGDDLIREGDCGQIIPIEEPEAIRQTLEAWAADRDRLAAMRSRAVIRARDVSWRAYRNRLTAWLSGLLAEDSHGV
ncbi:MAG: glycosyltransferase family 4 protein [Opitutales bacterium]